MTAVQKKSRKKNSGLKIFPQTIASGRSRAKLAPVINVGSDTKEYIIYLAVPGMERKDFSVTINNNELTVSAAKTEALHCFSNMEQTGFPEWKQTFTLPEDADTVLTAAIYKNGELEIHIPKGSSNRTGSPVELFVY